MHHFAQELPANFIFTRSFKVSVFIIVGSFIPREGSNCLSRFARARFESHGALMESRILADAIYRVMYNNHAGARRLEPPPSRVTPALIALIYTQVSQNTIRAISN